MTPAQADLTRRYRAALDQIRNRFGAVTADAFAALPHHDKAQIVDMVAAITGPAAVTRARTAQLTSGYLAVLTHTHTPVTATARDLPAVDLAELVRPAFMTVWGALKDGHPYTDAVAAGLERAHSVGRFLVSDTSRQTASVVDKAEPKFTSWLRVPEAGACQWCQDVADQPYASAESADIGHDNCHCDIVPDWS